MSHDLFKLAKNIKYKKIEVCKNEQKICSYKMLNLEKKK